MYPCIPAGRLVRLAQGLAFVQAIGGVVFAVGYELEKNLVVPVTIHCLGNVVIFLLPIFW